MEQNCSSKTGHAVPANDGKRLESLVGIIECTELPDGFEVQTNVHVYEDGVPSAELDILITGKIGSATFRFLIECRDRPSDGPAPVSWIEQLAGRRERLNLDKVMAVSSTGFTEPAKKFAQSKGIDLRSLDELRLEDIQERLPSNAPIILRHGQLLRVGLRPMAEGHAELPPHLDPEAKRFRHEGTGKIVSGLEIWNGAIKCDEAWEGIPRDGMPHTRKIRLGSAAFGKLYFVSESSEMAVNLLELEGVFTILQPSMPLVEAARYISQPFDRAKEEMYAELYRWATNDSEMIKELVMLVLPTVVEEE